MHETSKAHTKFVIKETDFSEFTIIKKPYGFTYCLIEIPSQWKAIYEDQLKGDTILIIEKRLISESKIVKSYVKKRPKNLNQNEFYFQGGNWTIPKEINIGPVCGRGYTVKEIQMRLNKIGYTLPENNIMNQDTKDALLDFQRKNGLNPNNSCI